MPRSRRSPATAPARPRLADLDLGYNTIATITPLANLTNLTVLQLSGNGGIVDVSPLARMTKLTKLTSAGNKISDIVPLSGLVNLRMLWLIRNELTDITPVAGLTKLRFIDVAFNRLDLSPGSYVQATLAYLRARGVQLSYRVQAITPTTTTLTGPSGVTVDSALRLKRGRSYQGGRTARSDHEVAAGVWKLAARGFGDLQTAQRLQVRLVHLRSEAKPQGQVALRGPIHGRHLLPGAESTASTGCPRRASTST